MFIIAEIACSHNGKIHKLKKLINDKQYLDKILSDGADKAEQIAGKKIKEMKKLIGF